MYKVVNFHSESKTLNIRNLNLCGGDRERVSLKKDLLRKEN